MIIEVDNERVFIPKWGGNREQDGAEQIKVTHRFLKAGERKKYIYTKPLKLSMETGTVSSDIEYIQDEQGICKALITKIENLEVKDKKSGAAVKIDSAAALYNTPGVPQGLVAEIETYMFSASPEVDTDFL